VKILLLAMSLTVLTVMMHSVGTYGAIAHARKWQTASIPRPWVRVVGTMGGLVMFLLIVHLVEAAIWAAALFWWEAIPDFSTALYYSLTSYSTVGYGDVLLPESARLLGPIESVLGVMMLGWSTAVIVAVVQKVFRETTPGGQVPPAAKDSSTDDSVNRSQESAGPGGT
jgi:voltage-gated potassium channel